MQDGVVSNVSQSITKKEKNVISLLFTRYIIVLILNNTCCGGTLNALALVSTLVHTSIQGLMNTTPE